MWVESCWPFKIRPLGHFGLTLEKLDEAVHFYTNLLGLRISEQQDVADTVPARLRLMLKAIKNRVVYMTRYNTDHHSLVLIGKPLY